LKSKRSRFGGGERSQKKKKSRGKGGREIEKEHDKNKTPEGGKIERVLKGKEPCLQSPPGVKDVKTTQRKETAGKKDNGKPDRRGRKIGEQVSWWIIILLNFEKWGEKKIEEKNLEKKEGSSERGRGGEKIPSGVNLPRKTPR